MTERVQSAPSPIAATDVPDDGIWYRGRPTWLTDQMLTGLQEEAKVMRETAEKIHTQFFGDIGPAGRAFMELPELTSLVCDQAAEAKSSGKANYRYYDYPGCHISPHMDDNNFAVNVNLMLYHNSPGPRTSALVLFPSGPRPNQVFLDPGELIVFFSKGVVHGRSPVGDNEEVCNLGVGFTPLRPISDAIYWRP